MDEEEMVLVRSSFPVTGQPIRVVMIDGEPWFVTADVCRVLGRENPSRANRLVAPADARVVNSRLITLTFSTGNDVSAGGNSYGRGNPMLNLISESGLYTLIMRSNKQAAKPFQEWVTAELLPSVRRGDTDVPGQRRRMARTLAEAVGQQVEIVAEIDRDGGPGIHVRSDGTVHCRHGEMVFRVPSREEDSGPPFGAYFSCPSVERVGIRGGRAIPRCAKLKLVDLIRLLAPAPAAPGPAADDTDTGTGTGSGTGSGTGTGTGTGVMVVEIEAHRARAHGTARQIAELMRALDE
ncbi:Bro-N domain-containing protein [Kitasatospora sp. NBC_00315]|uniref:BRO-N domain-containing protein n=1 Tax=Kitasatospora sp. NBC_00315 TaxID=2975963 RepID=UPI00324B81CC